MMGPTDEHDLLKGEGGGGDCALYASQFSKLGIFPVFYYSLEGGEMLVTGEAIGSTRGGALIPPPPVNMLDEALPQRCLLQAYVHSIIRASRSHGSSDNRGTVCLPPPRRVIFRPSPGSMFYYFIIEI